jgi:hypothetical protein
LPSTCATYPATERTADPSAKCERTARAGVALCRTTSSLAPVPGRSAPQDNVLGGSPVVSGLAVREVACLSVERLGTDCAEICRFSARKRSRLDVGPLSAAPAGISRAGPPTGMKLPPLSLRAGFHPKRQKRGLTPCSVSGRALLNAVAERPARAIEDGERRSLPAAVATERGALALARR